MKNNSKGKKRKFIILTTFLIPSLVIFVEAFCAGLISLRKVMKANNIKSGKVEYIVSHKQLPDIITGHLRFGVYSKDLKNKKGFIDQHGLIRTIYTSNSDEDKNIKGILITGNSVSIGYPMTRMGEYQDSFVNLLEKNIRKKDGKIDIINLSGYGFNSWQENIQVARYFNSEVNHNDLPSNIELIASIGGIQDFWGFITLLNTKDYKNDSFYKANGLMSLRLNDHYDINGIYLEKSRDALQGNIKSSFEIFSLGLLKSFQNNSNFYRFFHAFKSYLNTKLDNSKDENDIKLAFKRVDINQILDKKLKISSKEYKQKKDLVVQSVVRNIRSISAINGEGNVLFVYLPTRFSLSEIQKNVDKRLAGFKMSNLNVYDLGVLERDYRESLLEKLSLINGIKIANLASTGEDSWFFDKSHFTKLGHKEIAKNLIPIFENVLNLEEN